MNKFKTVANKVGVAEKAARDEARRELENIGTSYIEISISCRNLADKDDLSKSDPICVIYYQPNKEKWAELKKTELIENNLNPDFATKLKMEYRFEQAQHLRFQIYDIDSLSEPIQEEDTIGYLECTVAQIIAAGAHGFKQELEPLYREEGDMESVGSIILIAEELAASKDEIFLELCGNSVGHCMSCLGVTSFFQISRMNDAGNFVIAHRCSETRGMNPTWPELTILGRSLCYGDKERTIKIEVWRKTVKNEDQLVGHALTTVKNMAEKTNNEMTLVKANGKETSTSISIRTCNVSPVFTFMQFIQAGTQLHLCFSIDFTKSNGDYNLASSLHYISPDKKKTNPYEQAIEATGLILQDYDDDNVFDVYGFGAKIPPLGKISHNFPVTLTQNPSCMGIDGVLKAYRKCIKRIELFGPTHFQPVLNTVIEQAERSTNGLDYYILVILTDGAIEDMVKTKQALIKASRLPISIIIIGIGQADFNSMEELDGDDDMGNKNISYMGEVAERDIVQFVEYRSAEHWMKQTGERTADSKSFAGIVSTAVKHDKNSTAQGRLAEEILKEIPEQITSYMKARGIDPPKVSKAKAITRPPDPLPVTPEPKREA